MASTDKTRNSESAEDHTEKQSKSPPQETPIIPNIAPPPPPNDKIEYRLYTNTPWWKTLAELVGVAAVVWYACITHSMWVEMQKQTSTARDQLEQSERPWIKIMGLKTLGNGPFIPALSFQGFGHGPYPQGRKQATLQTVISIKNIGHSRALVSMDSEMFFPPWRDDFEDIILAEQKRFCDASAKKPQNKYSVRILFPEDPMEWGGAVIKPVNPMIPPDTLARNPEDQIGDYILPVIVICSNYRFKSSTTTTEYQSRALYVVSHETTGMRFFKVGQDIPANELRLSRDEMADDAY